MLYIITFDPKRILSTCSIFFIQITVHLLIEVVVIVFVFVSSRRTFSVYNIPRWFVPLSVSVPVSLSLSLSFSFIRLAPNNWFHPVNCDTGQNAAQLLPTPYSPPSPPPPLPRGRILSPTLPARVSLRPHSATCPWTPPPSSLVLTAATLT